ncbi:WD repeat domain-containing protein 83 [Fasciola hepatica]|uniref:WD repeat domain-containing protein 83 n=1 Tax=Fasciola hepatica TaxID=6192 RepID=A0A4E0RM59_FASHE|nr:WD repeat domain-containing protein 83 [Fasciola hepatica]
MGSTGTSNEGKLPALPTQASRRIHCHQSAVRAARFNSDGMYCMTAGGDKTIKLWNPYTCRLLKTYTGHGGEVSDVRAGADNSQLGSGGADCLVMLWDVSTGQSVRRWRRHAGRVNAVQFASPFQRSESGLPSPILISAAVDGMVLVWDARARTPYPVQTMHEAKDSVSCVSFSRWQIITGSVDRCVRTYDIRRGEMTEDYVGYPVTSVSMTVDCQCILVGTQDSTLRLFDAFTGELLNKYLGHTNKTYRMDSVLMNHDAHVVSGSEELGLVFIWDFVRSNSSLLTLDHSPGGPAWGNLPLSGGAVSQLVVRAAESTNFLVHSLSAHPSQSRLLTSGGDFVWLWDAEPNASEGDDPNDDTR